LPASVVTYIEKGQSGQYPETAKTGEEIFEKTQNIIIASNTEAVAAAKKCAGDLGYHTLVLSSYIEGETRDVARVHAAIIKEILNQAQPLEIPSCVISGGETTVTIRGEGKGGRNQEFVLAASIDIAGLQPVVVLSAGTDGTDGPTDAAGAICDGDSISRAKNSNLSPAEFLDNNDSYTFFEKLNDLIITGPTNTNVMDLRIMLVGE
jgi:hydroxypyruvate reductase